MASWDKKSTYKMNYVESELLISEVKRHECLYNYNNENYKNRIAKVEAWSDISKNVIDDDWEQLNEHQQASIERELQRRWKSIKDAYVRSVRTRETKIGDDARRQKPYIYEKQMSFLKPFLTYRTTTCPKYDTNEDYDQEFPKYDIQSEEEDEEHTTSTEDGKRPTTKRKYSEMSKFENDPLEILINSPPETPSQRVILPQPEPVVDEDKMFLLSLLPYMKEMNSMSKLDFKIETLANVKKIISKQTEVAATAQSESNFIVKLQNKPSCDIP